MSDDAKFPAKSAHSSGKSGDKLLDVVSIAFSDRISIMIYSNGRQGKLFSVALSSLSAVAAEVPKLPNTSESNDDYLLPLPYITPTQLVGSDFNDVQGRFYASLIASMVARQAPQERRLLVIGIPYDLGPREEDEIEKLHRTELLEVVKLIQKARVW